MHNYTSLTQNSCVTLCKNKEYEGNKCTRVLLVGSSGHSGCSIQGDFANEEKCKNGWMCWITYKDILLQLKKFGRRSLESDWWRRVEKCEIVRPVATEFPVWNGINDNFHLPNVSRMNVTIMWLNLLDIKDEEDCSMGREEHKLGTFCLGRIREDSNLGECPCIEDTFCIHLWLIFFTIILWKFLLLLGYFSIWDNQDMKLELKARRAERAKLHGKSAGSRCVERENFSVLFTLP